MIDPKILDALEELIDIWNNPDKFNEINSKKFEVFEKRLDKAMKYYIANRGINFENLSLMK